MKKIRNVFIGIISLIIICLVIIALAGIYKFNYLANQPGYDVDGNPIKNNITNNQEGVSYELNVSGEFIEYGNAPYTSNYLLIQNMSNESIVVKKVSNTSSGWIGNIAVLDTDNVFECAPSGDMTVCDTSYEISVGGSNIFAPSKEGGFKGIVEVLIEGKDSGLLSVEKFDTSIITSEPDHEQYIGGPPLDRE